MVLKRIQVNIIIVYMKYTSWEGTWPQFFASDWWSKYLVKLTTTIHYPPLSQPTSATLQHLLVINLLQVSDPNLSTSPLMVNTNLTSSILPYSGGRGQKGTFFFLHGAWLCGFHICFSYHSNPTWNDLAWFEKVNKITFFGVYSKMAKKTHFLDFCWLGSWKL